MNNYDERRKYKRYSIVIPLDISGKHFLQYKKTCNLSLGGVFIKTNLLEELGTQLKMDFLFDDEKEKIRVLGTVKWASRSEQLPGMGVEFIDPPANFLKKIEKYLNPIKDDSR